MSVTTQETHEVTTQRAAEAVSVEVRQFSKWARRRGLMPSRYVHVGRSRYAVWDLDEVYDALDRGPVARTKTN